jgi:hypothetical protein
VPPELGGLAALETLWLELNPLTGRLPDELTRLSNLRAFGYSGTHLCEPQDPAAQKWRAGLQCLRGTGVRCVEPLYLPAIQ